MNGRRVLRSRRWAALGFAVALMWVQPAAASQPTRTLIYPEAMVIPAGSGCAFDVLEEPLRGWAAVTEFSDGAFVLKAQVNAAITNVETGATFVHKARFHGVERFDPETGLIRGVTNGPIVWWLSPGDVGPYGVVEDPGVFVRIVGTVWYAVDPETGALVEFSYQGSIVDVCALIS